MRRFLVLLGMILGVTMPMAGNFMLNDALPAIERGIGRGELGSRWIASAYLITFTALMLAGGALGDRFGRRRLLMWGIVIFTASSAACGFVETPEQLIGARGAQGLGAALAVPATLSILSAAFPSKGRGAALGLWAAISAAAALYGPIAGTYILERYSWEWLFFINVPVGVVVFVLATAVEESRDPSLIRRFDLGGIFLGTAGLAFLSFGLAEGNARGWSDELIAGSLLLAALLLVTFLFVESRRTYPMVSVRYAGHATFSASNAVAAALFFAIFGMSIFLVAYLRNVMGYDPATTAIRLLPLAAILAVASPVAGMVSDRIGSRGLMTYGCVLAGAGLGLLLRAGLEPSYQSVILPALVLIGFAMALAAGPMTTAVTGVVNPGQAGGAAGATNTARQLGLLVGVALLGAVVTSAFKNSLLTALAEAGIEGPAAESFVETPSLLSVLTGASFESLREQLPTGDNTALLDSVIRAVQESFVDALHTGVLLSIGFLLLAAMISLIFVRSHVISVFRVGAAPAEREREGQAEMEDSPVEPLEPGPAGATPAPRPPVADTSGSTESESEPQVVPAAATESEVSDAEVEPPAGTTEEQAEVVLLSQPASAPDSSIDLTAVLFQFPFKAGTGTVVGNVSEFIRTTLRFYDQAGTPAPPAVGLPEPIAGDLNASTSADIATLTGYLLLEQRFGRINPQTRPELAATALIGAARSMKLWSFPGDSSSGDDAFLDGLIRVVMEGIGPIKAPGGDGTTAKQTPLSA